MFSRATIVSILVALVAGIGLAFAMQQRVAAPNPPSAPPDTFLNFLDAESRMLPVPEAKPTPPPANQPPCTGTQVTNFDCYGEYVKSLVRTKGIPAAFTWLRTAYADNSYVRSQCHPLTHQIGQAAVDKYPTAGEAYIHGDSFCWSGYYHGVLEGIVGKIGRTKFLETINDVCKDIPGKERYSFDYYNCLHGMGHGAMAMTETELFDSLTICDKLNGSWEQSSCWSGVFMENVIVDGKNHVTKYLKPTEPLYPCNAVDEKYKQTCYLMQTSYMLKATGRNFTKVFDLCAQADTGYVDTCYQSLGRDASGQSISNVAATKATCDLGKDFEARSNCIIGAAKDFISYYHGDTQAKQLCEAISPDLRQTCVDTVVDYVKVL